MMKKLYKPYMQTASQGAVHKARRCSQGHAVPIKREHTRFALILLVFFLTHTSAIKEKSCSQLTYSPQCEHTTTTVQRMETFLVFMCVRNWLKQNDLLLMGHL